MIQLLHRLFPICRSLTGDGVRRTLAILREELPDLAVHEVPTGTRVFDWTIPDEWNIRAARLTGPDGEVIADMDACNLHVVGYSEPVDRDIDLEELQDHLHSRPDLPHAVPYVTSYYKRHWGFCLPHAQRAALRPGRYHAFIDATLAPGSLTYADLILPGKEDREILLSTYVCHPSMANNELSGPVVAVRLAKWLAERPRRFGYRFVFAPETIGAIAYLSRHLRHLQEKTAAGFNLSCLGDDRSYSYVPSRKGGTLADRVALHVLEHFHPDFVRYSFLDRQSDERQYCAPGIDLPFCSVMRTKYSAFPEYHTSLDDLNLVTEKGLEGGYTVVRRCLEALEADLTYSPKVLCEPQMGRRGLYATLSTVGSTDGFVTRMMNLLAYIDGRTSLLDIAETIGLDVFQCDRIAQLLVEHGIIDPPK
jgi:aminopeptidase-like protein